MTSGFRIGLSVPKWYDGPLDEKYEIIGDLKFVEPTVITKFSKEGGERKDLQDGPSFPAEATIATPTLYKDFTAWWKVLTAQPSEEGLVLIIIVYQPYEFPITCGLNSCFGFFPFKSVGAKKNCKQDK